MSTKDNREIEKLKRSILKEQEQKQKEIEKNKLKKIKMEKLEEEKEKNKVNSTRKELLKIKEELEEENKKEEDNKFKVAMSNLKRRHKKEGYHVFAIVIILIAIVLSFVLMYMAANKLSDKVYKNVYLGKHYVGSLTEKKLEEKIIEIYEEENLKIIVAVKQGEKLIDTISPQDIDLAVDIPATKKDVLNFGRDANIFKNNLNIFKALVNKKVINFSYSYNKDKLSEAIKVMQTSLDTRKVDDKYELNEKDGMLIVTKGKEGFKIDEEKMQASVDKIFSKQKDAVYQLETVKEEPERLDIDKVYNEVHKEAKDATVKKDANGQPIFEKEVYGITFDKANLKQELDKVKDGETLQYKLDVKEPKVKYNDIRWEGYEDVIGQQTTYFPAGIYARSINLRTALGHLNGVIIMPGETFSYNAVIGSPTAAKGYKPAATFKGGMVVNEVGGGICQTVSTLYNAALYANLEIVERHPHGLAVGYVKPSLDATMYHPVKDLKIKNNRKYPLKIVTYFSADGTMNIKLMGTKQDDDVQIELQSVTLSSRKYGVTYVNDSSLPKGKQVVKSNGANGYTSEAYKITKKNGAVIKKERLSRDTYKPTNKVVRVGV